MATSATVCACKHAQTVADVQLRNLCTKLYHETSTNLVQVVQEYINFIKQFYTVNATNVVVVHNSTSINFEGLYVYLTHGFQEVDSIPRETVKQKQ